MTQPNEPTASSTGGEPLLFLYTSDALPKKNKVDQFKIAWGYDPNHALTFARAEIMTLMQAGKIKQKPKFKIKFTSAMPADLRQQALRDPGLLDYRAAFNKWNNQRTITLAGS